MSIPDKKLIITGYDVDTLKLSENRVLFGREYNVDDFYQFLLDHVDHVESWTAQDIGELTRGELGDVRQQLFAALADAREVTPPLAPSPDTGSGPAANPS